jgi:hypothetical protein
VQLKAPAETWVWRRGKDTVIALNLSGKEVRIPSIKGRIELHTSRRGEGTELGSGLVLGPWEGALCSSASI